MSKKVILGLNSFNSDVKVSNSNWENRTSEPVFVEQGDTIALKSSYIDTRNRVSGNIILDQNTTIELSYYFYYVNRGGTTIQSRVTDSNFPNRQQLVSEYFNYGDETTNMTNVQPTGVSFQVPVTNDSTGKVPENLSPLAESIYHTYNSDNITNWTLPTNPIPLNQVKAGLEYEIIAINQTPDSDFVALGASLPIYNNKFFTTTQNGSVITPNPNPVVQFKDIAASTAYVIDNIGLPFQGGYDTNWNAIGYNIYSYPTNISFTSNATPAATTFISVQNNITSINTGITYNVLTTSDYIDWSLYGGPSRPANSNPNITLTTPAEQQTLQNGVNYYIIYKGIPYKDGYDTDWLILGDNTIISNIFTYTQSVQFPLIQLQTIQDLLQLQEGHILNVNIPENIDDTNYFVDWNLFGASPKPVIQASQEFAVSFSTSIVNEGVPFVYRNYLYDTDWTSLGASNIEIGATYNTKANVTPTPISVVNDFYGIRQGVSYKIISTDPNIDWSQYGATQPANTNPVIPATQAVVGQIYNIIDRGFKWNNLPFFVNTDTDFQIGGASTYDPTRFLCTSAIVPYVIIIYSGGSPNEVLRGGDAINILQGMSITITERGVRGNPNDIENPEPFDWSIFGGPGINDPLPATFTATKNFIDVPLSPIFEEPYNFSLSITPTATIQLSSDIYTGTTFVGNVNAVQVTGFAPTPFELEVIPTGTITGLYTGVLEFEVTEIPEASKLNDSLQLPPTTLMPTGVVQQINPYAVPFQFTSNSNGTYAVYDEEGINKSDLTYTANVIPTGSVQEPYQIAMVQEVGNIENINHILANNPSGFINTQDINSPDGLPYLLCYSVPKNIDGSTNFDKSIMNPGDLVPFVKKWKMVLKAGSYSPDYLAEVISRGMSIQKTKLNRLSKIVTTKNSFLGTPTQGVQSQLYKSIDLSYLRNYAQVNSNTTSTAPLVDYFGYSARDCQQGPFPNPNQIKANVLESVTTYPVLAKDPPPSTLTNTPIDIDRLNPSNSFAPYPPDDYQPNLFWNSKNKNIMPGYNGNYTTLPNQLPVNPKYTDLDFNDPDSDYQDDLPFVYRPNAFTHVDKNQQQGNVRLIFNDYNLSNYNDMPPFGTTSDTNTKCIEMMYRPLISDVDSSYYNNIQEKNGLPISKDYSIRPVISASVANIKGGPGSMDAFKLDLGDDGLGPIELPIPAIENAYGMGYSAPCDISTPVVGSSLMALSYNNENNGLFEFPYMHTPIYSKPLTTGTDLQESSAMYPSNVIISNQEPPSTTPVDVSVIINSNDPLFETSDYGGFAYPVNNGTTTIEGNVYKNTGFKNVFNNVDGVSPAYVVWKGSLFPGGKDGINDLTFTITEWEKSDDPYVGQYWNTNLIVSGLAPIQQPAKTFTKNNSVIQIGSQSGIIFKDMKATKADGTSMPFWEQLGFDVPNITHNYDTKNPSDFMLKYETFSKSTTTAFQGTSTLFDPQTLSSGTNELSYVSYVDSLNMIGWYVDSSIASQNATGIGMIADINDPTGKTTPGVSPITEPPFNNNVNGYEIYNVMGFQGNFVLQNKILYSAVDTTNSLAAKVVYSDFTETGHALVCIEGYNGVLITQTDKLNVKSLVSTYYTGPNAFITNSSTDSAVYEHVGMPMKLQNFKVRILSPYTNKELVNLGPNSSIYLEITKTLTKDNEGNITFDN
jgi:hypothetical protein